MWSRGGAIRYGTLAWLILVARAVLACPFDGPAPPVFESIGAVVVTRTAVALGLAVLRHAPAPSPADCATVGGA